MHFTDKTHFFRDEQDNRTTVITMLIGDGYYGAILIEGEPAGFNLYGFGYSRFEAIADLNEKIQQAREEEGSEVPGFDDATRNDEYFRP